MWRMKQRLVSDEFWSRVEPVIPVVERRRRYPGRKRVDDRACLEAIMYVLKTGCQWAMVPVSETGCTGKTAWRRMDEWDRAGVWDEWHERLLAELPLAVTVSAGNRHDVTQLLPLIDLRRDAPIAG